MILLRGHSYLLVCETIRAGHSVSEPRVAMLLQGLTRKKFESLKDKLNITVPVNDLDIIRFIFS